MADLLGENEVEPQLVAICCSQPPAGRVCWTMQMLADALKERRIVTQISAETVRRALKKTSCSPGESSVGAFPSEIGLGLSPKWRRSWIPTPRNIQTKSR